MAAECARNALSQKVVDNKADAGICLSFWIEFFFLFLFLFFKIFLTCGGRGAWGDHWLCSLMH